MSSGFEKSLQERSAADYADFLGEGAVARGWLRRARRLLDGLETIPEHGWLAAPAPFSLSGK